MPFKKTLKNLYWSGAALIVLLVFSAYFSISYTLDLMLEDTRVVNEAGRQRMRSQQIAKSIIALMYTVDTVDQTTYQQELTLISSDFKRVHEGLKNGNLIADYPIENTPAINQLFKDITPSYQNLLKNVTQVAELPATDSAKQAFMASVLAEEQEFLPLMNEITTLYAQEGKKKNRDITNDCSCGISYHCSSTISNRPIHHTTSHCQSKTNARS